MTNIIIFSVFGAALYVLVTGGIGLYLASEKGHAKWIGFLLGIFVPGFGLIVLGLVNPTRQKLLDAAYEQSFIDRKAYDALTKTTELIKSPPKSKGRNHKVVSE